MTEPADFMSLAAHLAIVNAGRPVIERESDGAVFVHRDVCIEAMQALRCASSDAARDVLAERKRQVEAEGWTPEHDNEHDEGELAAAAAAYAMTAVGTGKQDMRFVDIDLFVPEIFPTEWGANWWKPSDDKRRNLVKAGALILAEIERLDRAAKPVEES
jgi:hypothetical protein